MNNDSIDYRRLFVAIALAALLLTGWQTFVEWPRRQKIAAFTAEQAKVQAAKQNDYAKASPTDAPEDNPNLTRDERIARSPRIKIVSDKLHGSIALKGARFDDLTLAQYRETLDKNSPEVTLLSPSGDAHAYFSQLGWVAPDGKTAVPDQSSLWQADHNILTPENPVTLSWNNNAGVIYKFIVSLDADYMFTIKQEVENHSTHPINVVPYGYVNRAYDMAQKQRGLTHEGPMGIVDKALKEISYDTLRKDGNQHFDSSEAWFGITDKYWLAAIVPNTPNFKTTYSYYQKNGIDRYQVDYTGAASEIAPGGQDTQDIRMFTGAKEIKVLNRYTDGDATHPPILLFDRAVDFGMLYFLTKPLFLLLNFFYTHTGNFGVAILLLTIVVKLCMFPLANKSYKATSQMRRLQPHMTTLKEKHADDKATFQKELMALYKREKVNPASGCLPILVQMPVFFALYRVLSITIEMRHAPFYGWLKDLSVRDPANIFTGFGYFNYQLPDSLNLGVLPILMCATMVIQMRQQPAPADPAQAKMMKVMPYFMLFVFTGMPAGLVLYWTWSNLISIIQSFIIARSHNKLHPIVP